MMIAEVCLETNDVPGLANFYKRLLGIYNGSNDAEYQVLLNEGTVFSIVHEKHRMRCHNISLCFTVEDIVAAARRALDLGAIVYDPPEEEPGGTVSLRIEDLDGNTVYLRSTEKEVWEVWEVWQGGEVSLPSARHIRPANS